MRAESVEPCKEGGCTSLLTVAMTAAGPLEEIWFPMIDPVPLKQGEGLQVPRITAPIPDVFEREYLKKKRPVVFTHAAEMEHTLSIGPDMLRAAVDNRPVQVNRCDSTGRTFVIDHRSQTPAYDTTTMPFTTFLDAVQDQEAHPKVRYFHQNPFSGSLLEAGVAIGRPRYLEDAPLLSKLWIGGGGNRTGLHYDEADNFLVQISGKKNLILYSPDDTGFLYHCPLHPDRLFNCSLVDTGLPNHKKFPLFHMATPFFVELQPGDMLFIPALWWHYVESVSFNLAVNFWWRPNSEEANQRIQRIIR
jgi:ribosomal protein L16 Arg81 hydroxylase